MDNAAFSPNSNSNEPTTPESRPNDVTPPFSESLKIRSEGQYTHPAGVNFPLELIRPSGDLPRYLACQLLTPKLNLIHHLLWLAGLPRAARPLHRQKLMQRAFILTESPDEHLVWSPGRIFIKPVPEYLLDHGFWVQNICPDRELHAAACGLLLSYAWLISELIDFQIAKDEHIIPNDVTWDAWTKLIHELLQWIDDNHIDDSCNDDSPPTQNDPSHQPRPVIINKRYEFGELRLPRLNAIYRLTPTAFSFYNFVFGFMSVSTWYQVHEFTDVSPSQPEDFCGGILVDDMGLGKTLSMIISIVAGVSCVETTSLTPADAISVPVKPTLIIVPTEPPL
ncbi:hypothetical protein ASPBRDRAFT_62942 [Aspergillus brasiliensis CBS 101740]|uniref:SNF2 N-terminal domain-containing protein n=1 Tax=Aspergillus brasiliensis (strain CBS 101740 / IMI 381727 / IBT 21946) TaxID=767769 RepID=A0A1L9URQ3_ASPBC|nr:hypothetical protein ASPBRDRAFT_62942 [Aspergillus brasiliensis CBS 101740]